jgi:hypothetical protein
VKLFPHYQLPPPWAGDFHTKYVKQIFYDGNDVDFFPESNTIARLWMERDEEEYYVRMGAVGGDKYFERLLPWYRSLDGKVLAFEGPNEPDVSHSAARRDLSAFTWSWVRRMRLQKYLTLSKGYNTISGLFSNGNPDITNVKTMQELWGAFAGTYLGLHQYGWPNMQDYYPWYSLRHRFLIEVRKGMGLSTPYIFITECGLDGTEQGQGGWQGIMNWEMYRGQLEWYNSELEKDNKVLGAFPFTSGPWGPLWKSFEVNEQQWKELGKSIM